MPYNNAPIAPPEEITGSSTLPLARVKKIISQDPDLSQCSNSAAFAISVATEIFIRYLTESAYNVVKTERSSKPRRNIAYKDIATAISRIDNLEFLSDVVPKTKTYRQFKEDKAREEAATSKSRPGTSDGVNGDGAGAGNKSIQHMMQQQSESTADGLANGDGDGVAETTTMVNGHAHGTASVPHSPMADRTLGHGHPDPIRDLDTEMTG